MGQFSVEKPVLPGSALSGNQHRTVKALCTIRGIGVNFASVLTREVFYRTFDNRRQIASYLGLAPTPFQSGGMDRDRRINRAGNSRARKTLVQLAWLWLRYQPESSHAAWFRDRQADRSDDLRRPVSSVKASSMSRVDRPFA